MARAKDRPAAPAKTAKSAPKPAKAAPDALGTQPPSSVRPSPEQLYRMIQETAYFKAKARNFAPGHEIQDWIEAEAEVRQRLEARA
jgi:hypothetical protein